MIKCAVHVDYWNSVEVLSSILDMFDPFIVIFFTTSLCTHCWYTFFFKNTFVLHVHFGKISPFNILFLADILDVHESGHYA